MFNIFDEVDYFIKGKLPWIKIATVVGKTLEATQAIDPQNLDEVLDADAEARVKASEIAQAIA